MEYSIEVINIIFSNNEYFFSQSIRWKKRGKWRWNWRHNLFAGVTQRKLDGLESELQPSSICAPIIWRSLLNE